MATYTTNEIGRRAITVANADGSTILVYEQGAHLASWKTSTGKEMLYCSPAAIYQNGTALRGGVPLIFPQFGNRGPLQPSHGFARIRPWQLGSAENGCATFTLRASLEELMVDQIPLSESANNVVELTYTINFSNTNLDLGIRVLNMSDEASASFHFAFHTYFAVDSTDSTTVNGFNRTPFVDSTAPPKAGGELCHPETVWTITGEVDRIYPDQACAIMLTDNATGQALHISGENLCDVVLWNPGPGRCAAMKDLPPDGYKHFICVEHGSIMKRVSVAPCSAWQASQRIRLLHSGSPTKL